MHSQILHVFLRYYYDPATFESSDISTKSNLHRHFCDNFKSLYYLNDTNNATNLYTEDETYWLSQDGYK